MLLKISHVTEYAYTTPISYALQRLRLTPHDTAMQKIHRWETSVDGAEVEASYTDHFGNMVEMVSITGRPSNIRITASGTVETIDTSGIVGQHRDYMPLWLYQRETALTKPGKSIREVMRQVEKGADLERLHSLMTLLHEKMVFEPGSTHSQTIAEDALTNGHGVCQDHAHAFISAARAMGFPARYASGYLHMPEIDNQVASHAWAEAHLDDLGWVGFDPANDSCPDENYVLIAYGFDFLDASPVSGVQAGAGDEKLTVTITVEQ